MAGAAGFGKLDLALALSEAAALVFGHLPRTMRAGDTGAPVCMLTIGL